MLHGGIPGGSHDEPAPTRTHAVEFGKLFWATGCQVSADFAPELVFVCDGPAWIWDLVEQYYPQAVQIVDWYHAEDRLKRVADAIFTSPAQRQAWLAPVTESLWQGQVKEVLLACQLLARKHEEAKQAVTYFSNNSQRMRYDLFRTRGYLIGSGTIKVPANKLSPNVSNVLAPNGSSKALC